MLKRLDPNGPCMCLHQRFSESLRSLGIHKTISAALALSGGPDSLALALLASKWLERELSAAELQWGAPRWVALVLDHRLRNESADEARTAVQQAQELGFEAVLLEAAWPNGPPEKRHAMVEARRMRYSMLEAKCMELKFPVLMTAHHADDQAESGLIRLARASGIDGLQGMLPSRPFLHTGPERFSGKVVRPLLQMHKHELLALCRQNDLRFAEDPTNRDVFFSRNHLRELLSSRQSPVAALLQGVKQLHLSHTLVRGHQPPVGNASMTIREEAEQMEAHRPVSERGSHQSTLSSDVLRLMAACGAASKKLRAEADVLFAQARLPGAPMRLDPEILCGGSKPVAVRALAKALQEVTHPAVGSQTNNSAPRRAAAILWTALQPGKQPHAFARGSSIDCHVPAAPHVRVQASLVSGCDEAGCNIGGKLPRKPRKQALLLKSIPL